MRQVPGLLFVIAACGLWAADTLIRYPLLSQGIGAINIVFFEHLILSIVSLVVFFKSFGTLWNAKTSHYFYFFILGAFGSAWATIAFTQAFVFLNPSLVIILQKFQPIFAIVLARVVLGEVITKSFLFWALISICGALLISYEDLVKVSQLTQSGAGKGYLLVAFSIIGWASATVFGKKLSLEGFNNEQIMAGRFMMGLLAIIPFVSFDSTLSSYPIETYGKITLMVFVSGLLAMYLYYQGLKRVSAHVCAIGELFFPFMAVIVNWIFLGHELTQIQLIGAGVLLFSSFVVQLKKY